MLFHGFQMSSLKRKAIRVVVAFLSATTVAFSAEIPMAFCGASAIACAPEQRMAIAVYRITSMNEEVEHLATSALTTAVSKLSAAHPVERLKLRHALSEEVLRREGIARPGRRNFDGVNSADYLIVGEADFEPNAAWTAGGGVCRLHLRLVDTLTGDVVAAWSSRGIATGGNPYGSIAYAAEYAAEYIAKLFPARGQVMAVDGQLVYVSLTVSDNAECGDTVWIYPRTFTVRNPSTGNEIVIRGRHVKGKIVETSPEYCVVKVGKGFANGFQGEEIVELKK